VVTVTDSPYDAVSFPSYFTMETKSLPHAASSYMEFDNPDVNSARASALTTAWLPGNLTAALVLVSSTPSRAPLAMCGRSRLAENAIASTGARRDWCASPRTATSPAAGSALRGALNASTKRLFTAHPSPLDGTFNRGNQHDGSRQQAPAGSVAAFATGQLTTNSAPEKQGPRIAHKHASLGIKPDQYQAVHDELMGTMRSRPRSLPRGKRCTG
jgi:hypothetical protein